MFEGLGYTGNWRLTWGYMRETLSQVKGKGMGGQRQGSGESQNIPGHCLHPRHPNALLFGSFLKFLLCEASTETRLDPGPSEVPCCLHQDFSSSSGEHDCGSGLRKETREGHLAQPGMSRGRPTEIK